LKCIEGLAVPGCSKVFYEESLAWELESRGLSVLRQLEVPLRYKGNVLATPLKLDLLANKLVIVEVKAVRVYNKIFEAQALTYLRLMNLKLALVINFGEAKVGSGIHRVANGVEDQGRPYVNPLRLSVFAYLR